MTTEPDIFSPELEAAIKERAVCRCNFDHAQAMNVSSDPIERVKQDLFYERARAQLQLADGRVNLLMRKEGFKP